MPQQGMAFHAVIPQQRRGNLLRERNLFGRHPEGSGHTAATGIEFSEFQTRDAAPDWAFRGVTGLSILLALLANALYVVGGCAWRGRTPGKSLLGLTVVKRGEVGGRGNGWKAALIRAVVLVLAGLPLGLGWIWAFFEKEKRAFQDLAAGTWVVRSR